MITPLHIVAALPVKFWYPKQFSLMWFSITNVLIDIEVLYYMSLLEWPIHRFFHSLVGVTIIGVVCFILSMFLKHKKLPSFLFFVDPKTAKNNIIAGKKINNLKL